MRGAPGVLIIAPAWTASGSFQVFKSQCKVFRSLGFEIFFVAVPDSYCERSIYDAAVDDYRSQARALDTDHLAVAGLPRLGRNRKSAAFDRAFGGASEALKANKCAALLTLPLAAVLFATRKKDLLVLCNHYFNLPFAQRLLRFRSKKAPMILETHDIQSKQFQTMLDLPERAYEASLADELRALGAADLLVHISDTEYRVFADALPAHPHRLVYPYIAEGRRGDSRHAEISFLMVASWTHTNAFSLDWFLNEVWSRYQGPGNLVIVGNIDDCMRDLYPATFEKWKSCFVGRVDDLAAFYDKAAMVLLPMKQGEGIAIKFAEALAHGKRILFTPEAARGLPRDVEHEFADSLCKTADDFLSKMQAATDLDVVRFDSRSFGLYERLFSWDRYRSTYAEIVDVSLHRDGNDGTTDGQ